MAHGLWGHGLTAERDRRLRLGTGEARALRGHVTRKLLQELRKAIGHRDQQQADGAHVFDEILERFGRPDSVVIEEEDKP